MTPAVVEAALPTLPLAPGTSPRPAPPAECNAPVAQNFDSDIVGMTGVPGRKMYYGRSDKNSLASA